MDVLTLTATPIPRTLHLSLAGLRDLTLIETAPRDRSAILTFVEPWDDALLEEAFAREIDRGGQVFMVHNRIETIETIAARVRALAPRARVGVAHGQMPAEELESVMRRFVGGEVDILVSTMIVESGLDVPNANTMVVHDAHRFGLAQLYQLRGRVGRSHRRAYCYLLVPDTIDAGRGGAAARCWSITRTWARATGSRSRTWSCAGAGNLLGAEQSGHAQAVGFDLYMRWLEETVRALRGQGRSGAARAARRGARPAGPPAGRLRSGRRRQAGLSTGDWRGPTTSGEIDGLRDELRERFGPLPIEAETLLDMTRLRVLGATLGLQHVLVRGDEARLTFRPGHAAAAGRADDGARRRAAGRRGPPHGPAVASPDPPRWRGARARAGAGAAEGCPLEPRGLDPERSTDATHCPPRRRPRALAAASLAGCSNFRDLFTAHADVAAEAAGTELSALRLADILAGAGGRQRITREAGDFVAGTWVDYALFGQAVAEGKLPIDSASITEAVWPEISELKGTQYHDSLMAQRTALSDSSVDSLYHMLGHAAPAAHPLRREAERPRGAEDRPPAARRKGR